MIVHILNMCNSDAGPEQSFEFVIPAFNCSQFSLEGKAIFLTNRSFSLHIYHLT